MITLISIICILGTFSSEVFAATYTVTNNGTYQITIIFLNAYYGWGGDAQWSGFTSQNMGIVVTSLALDYFNNGKSHNVANNFINNVKSMPVLGVILKFSKTSLNAYREGEE